MITGRRRTIFEVDGRKLSVHDEREEVDKCAGTEKLCCGNRFWTWRSESSPLLFITSAMNISKFVQ